MQILLLPLLLLGFLFGQEIDEIEVLLNDKRIVSKPSSIIKKQGLWYISNSNELFTGRIEFFHKTLNDYITAPQWQKIPEKKVAECTIINGLKSGFFSQFYSRELMLSGIVGLYVNDKKEGTWIWIDPESGFNKYNWINSNLRNITSIDFRDGIKNGSVTMHQLSIEDDEDFYVQNYSYPPQDILIKGQYSEGNKNGEWLINDHILSDHNRQVISKYAEELSLYWTRKDIYENDELIDRECREPWDKYIDCDKYQEKYSNKMISLNERKYIPINEPTLTELASHDKVYLKDDNGQDVEVDVMKFIEHVDKFHSIGVSTHMEQKYVFTIDEEFRKMLKEKYWEQ